MKRLDLSGQRFGRLTAVSLATKSTSSKSFWECICECGTQTTVFIGNLRNGHTQSCGCLSDESRISRKTTHGLYGTPAHKSWSMMKVRCQDPANHKFASYGGRGIKVCEAWQSFESFLADMGDRPRGTTLGRIDNDGNYEPGNCRWETATEQARNKSNTRLFNLNGQRQTLQAHCDALGLNSATVKSRLYIYKWPVAKAFNQSTEITEANT